MMDLPRSTSLEGMPVVLEALKQDTFKSGSGLESLKKMKAG